MSNPERRFEIADLGPNEGRVFRQFLGKSSPWSMPLFHETFGADLFTPNLAGLDDSVDRNSEGLNDSPCIVLCEVISRPLDLVTFKADI